MNQFLIDVFIVKSSFDSYFAIAVRPNNSIHAIVLETFCINYSSVILIIICRSDIAMTFLIHNSIKNT
jgi:hypothetical protein